MATPSEKSCWSLESNLAVLRLPHFAATVNLLDASRGLAEMSYGDTTVNGSVLGITPSGGPIDSADELADVFVRGSDLVATFAQTDQRPFALQVYWRANLVDDSIVQVDVILSLQTCLLESFPDVEVTGCFSQATARTFSEDAASEESVELAAWGGTLKACGKDDVLVRPNDSDWSYAQRTHSEDHGDCEIARPDDGIKLAHRLGGQFLEKGVIRRLRLRGLFLPRENDIVVASQRLQGLETEEPPLTV